MKHENLLHKNGHGYALHMPEQDMDYPDLRFESDTYTVFDSAISYESCLIEGEVGAGKTHLIHDLDRLIRFSAPDATTLEFSVQKNVGTKRGVKHALDILDRYIETERDNGVILIDNIDMYGYSGSDGKRQYSLAKKHIEVARFLGDVITSPDTPIVIATSHTQKWRDQHWRYPEKKGSNDEVTPFAHDLLGTFAVKHAFSGLISKDVAHEILVSERGVRVDDAKHILSQLYDEGTQITHRVVTKIDPLCALESGLHKEIERVDKIAELLTNGVAQSRKMSRNY